MNSYDNKTYNWDKFGFSRNGKKYMLSEEFKINGKTTLLPHTKPMITPRHHNHLHVQGFKTSTIKIKAK